MPKGTFMHKYFILLLFSLLSAFPAAAADDVINRDMQQALEQTNRAVVDSVMQMDETMKKLMPEVTAGMTQMMIDIFNAFPPLMTAIERNQVLSKASKQLTQEVQKSAEELNAAAQEQADSAASPASPQITDEFSISGTKDENGRRLIFNFNQNPELTRKTQQAADWISSPGSEKKAMQLTTLSGQTYPLTDFKQERINNSYFLIRSPQNDTAYATGNVNDKINLRVETSGPDALPRLRAFIQEFRGKFVN